jgi:hypothetical protein
MVEDCEAVELATVPFVAAADHKSSAVSLLCPFLVGWTAYLLAMELLAGWILKAVPNGHTFDFSAFYAAGKAARTSPLHLYYPSVLAFPHLPYEALLYAPFTLASYHTAYLLFIGFNFILLLGAFLTGPLSRRAMLFAFIPVFVALTQGQDSILLLLICCFAWRYRDDPLRCGLILSLALFKFNIILPLGCLLALRKGWRFIVGFSAGCAALLLVCFSLVGRYGTRAFVSLIHSGSLCANSAASAQSAFAIYPAMMPNLMGLFYGLGARHLAALEEFLVTAAGSVLIFAWCAYRVRTEQEDSVAFGLATVCALLVSYHLYVHDLSLLLLAMALLRPPRIVLWALYLAPLILLLFFAAHYLFLAALPVLLLLHRGNSRRELIQRRTTVQQEQYAKDRGGQSDPSARSASTVLVAQASR